ncbi:FAD-binding monooxygenase [Nitzschia inconspicua]|uniref:FAD-binding monooxygenase n=1 Tax=Nitzschia inconspicua TaxID=303405 RepID=A0A9K3LZN5_9STRA|nr:FAD-binding monooxygenase [Nitzschia inconspicua]
MTSFRSLNHLLLALTVILDCSGSLSRCLALASPSSSGTKQIVVVGAGPAGLTSALVLARRHGYQVTILEANTDIDVYDPSKAYPFLIRERGQKLTKLFDDLQQTLEDNGIGVEGATKMISVPADPKVILDTEPKEITIFVPKGKNYWLRRHEFLRILLDVVAKEENITLLKGVECESVTPVKDSMVEVRATKVISTDKNTKETITMQSPLVIACDGMKSKVRESLAHYPSPFEGWENGNPDGFQVKKWTSPSTGLKFKTIHINANAKIPVGDGTFYEIPFGVQTFHTIRSRHSKDPKKFISLGLLPANKAPTRTFNIIRDDQHEIWSIKDGQALREWFSDSFPRFDFSSNSSLVAQEEFDRFASVEGLRLPLCQRSPELYVTSPNAKCGIVLVGDAVHCFPPDLGEGVNSGLEDVLALDEALSDHPDSVGDMARAYAKARKPESEALVRMVRFGAPFQYGQFGGITSVKRLLWTFNFFGRMILNKLTFGLSPRPVFVEVGDGYQSYSSVMRRADRLTAILWTITGALLLKLTGVLSKLSALAT